MFLFHFCIYFLFGCKFEVWRKETHLILFQVGLLFDSNTRLSSGGHSGFWFSLNTDLRALKRRRPKSFFQLFQTLDSQLEFRFSWLSEEQVWELGNLLDCLTDSEKKPVLLQEEAEEEEEEAMGSSRNLTLYVDLLSQPCRAVTIFCRYVIPPSNIFALQFSSNFCELHSCWM